MAKSSGNRLGRGIDALIPNTAAPASSKSKTKAKDNEQPKEVVKEVIKEVVKEVPVNLKLKVSEIEPNREQPRKQFNKDALEELAASIKEHGLIPPIIVQKKDGYYEIVAGERRWRAAKLAGIKEVPVIIKDYSSQELMEISLIENIQRQDLNPIEEAMAYKRLMDEYGLIQDDVAKKVSKSRSAITNSMRLLKLSDEVKEMLINEQLSSGHARALLSIDNPVEQTAIAQQVISKRLSVRETERLVKSYLNGSKPKKKPHTSEDDAVYKTIEEQLKSIMGSKVTINRKSGGKGKIEIEYYSDDDLERLIEMFNSIT